MLRSQTTSGIAQMLGGDMRHMSLKLKLSTNAVIAHEMKAAKLSFWFYQMFCNYALSKQI